MSDKKLIIIKKAMALFATKGYHSTSIQEIADQCEISKGAVYLHFSSKEELLLEIYKHYHEILKKKLHDNKDFKQYIEVFFNFFIHEREFILLLISGNVIQSRELEMFLTSVRKEALENYKKIFIGMFGPSIKPHVSDLTVMTEGILHSYLHILFSNHNKIDISNLSNYIVVRIKDLVAGLLEKQEQPQIIDNQMIVNLFQTSKSTKQELFHLLDELETEIEKADVDEEKREFYFQSLSILKEEAHKEESKKVIFKGMLANLEELETIHTYREKLLYLIDKL